MNDERTEALGDATYSPEDNKLRLYPLARLDKDDYEMVKAAGFKWAPKQELFVAGCWTPAREDLLFEMCGEVGDEAQPVAERAADRAERFAMYREKRRAEAHGLAGGYEGSPSTYNSRSAAGARRHDRLGGRACSQWEKAEYWQRRTAGVISSCLYKEGAGVIKRRILGLEKDLRRVMKRREEGHPFRVLWDTRWANHYQQRLTFQKALLGEQGEAIAGGDDWAPGAVVLYRGRRLTLSKVNKGAGGQVSSVQTVEDSGHWCANIPADRLTLVSAPTEKAAKEAQATAKKRSKLPPMLNRPGMYEMTQKDYSRRSQYGVAYARRVEIGGKVYRVRYSMQPRCCLGEVTLTDKPTKDAVGETVRV